MTPERVTPFTLIAIVSMLWIGLAPNRAAAQSELDVSEAQEFLGHWLVTFEGDQGEFLVELDMQDEGGKLAVEVTTIQLGTQKVTDVVRSEDGLELQWEADAQGQLIPVRVEITPQGEELAVLLDIGDGQFLADGVGART
ncbi:MAG: hypothetical protein PVJ80_13280 [Gemmatimonadota bacterium]|jgi:hypothetical protein